MLAKREIFKNLGNSDLARRERHMSVKFEATGMNFSDSEL
jgi:hypothetical protein